MKMLVAPQKKVTKHVEHQMNALCLDISWLKEFTWREFAADILDQKVEFKMETVQKALRQQPKKAFHQSKLGGKTQYTPPQSLFLCTTGSP